MIHDVCALMMLFFFHNEKLASVNSPHKNIIKLKPSSKSHITDFGNNLCLLLFIASFLSKHHHYLCTYLGFGIGPSRAGVSNSVHSGVSK